MKAAVLNKMLKGNMSNKAYPATRKKVPARNAKCPCGSGRKFKNCHAIGQ
jgi:uncharacterized protein YecA (UPF0149 family)